MKTQVLVRLNSINREFYQKFAGSFSQTRQRVQPGVKRVLSQIPLYGNWLDIGCGNGSLAAEWIGQGRSGRYVGADFSQELVRVARERVALLPAPRNLVVDWMVTDLNQGDWIANLPSIEWDGILMFAVLHHIPGQTQRIQLLKRLRALLAAGRFLYLSVWQPYNSPRLVKKLQPWASVGLDEKDVESGDVLMDWRAQCAESDEPGLRYVHVFEKEELYSLANICSFSVHSAFFSDGHENNLGLYQCWQAQN